MKKTSKLIALGLACASLFTISACGQTKIELSVSSNWYINANYQSIQPSSLTSTEVATYSVKHVAGVNPTFSVSYDEENCSLITTFGATTYDWSQVAVDAYKKDKTETVYQYTTTLTLKGEYKFTANGTTEAFDDVISSVSLFRSVGDGLAPVYSKQTVKCTAPTDLAPDNADEMVAKYDYVYETFYNDATSQATIKYTDVLDATNSATHTANGLDKMPYSMFDNGSLYAVMRATNTQTATAQPISLFIPAEKQVSAYSITGSATAELADDQTQIKTALINAGMAGADDKIKFNAVNFSKNADMQGANQVAWFASVENKQNNLRKGVMLKLMQGVSFGLGTLEYSLKTITF